MTALLLAAALAGALTGAHEGGACLRVTAPVEAGAVAVGGNFTPAACSEHQVSVAFRYDAVSRASHAVRALMPRDIVRVYAGYGSAAVEPGEKRQFVVHIGDVTIAREVEALQQARAGQRLFVRSEDGAVFAASYESLQP
jgi:hypothetical protein